MNPLSYGRGLTTAIHADKHLPQVGLRSWICFLQARRRFPDTDPEIPVTVATGYGFPGTCVAVSYLRAYGIHAVVHSFHHASVAWNLLVALGGMQIQVPYGQRETAIALLADVADRNDGLASPYVRHARLSAVIAVAFYLFFSTPPPARGLFTANR